MALGHRLVEQVAVLAAALERGLDVLDEGELRATLATLGAVHRLVDAAGVTIAGDVARRCDDDGMSDRWAERSAVAIVAGEAGVDVVAARAWCEVGSAVRPRRGIRGDALPARRSELGSAVEAAAMSAATLARIASTLDEVDERAPGHGATLMPILLAQARVLTVRELARVCRFAIEHADPEGVELREDERRRRRGVLVSHFPDGMLRWVATMDPESAGFLTAALDARTAPRREPRVEVTTAEVDPDRKDDRTLAQRRLDALVGMARTALRSDEGEVAGVDVTMLVTVPLEGLRTGIGAAEIEGVDAPISARTARRLAATARIVPLVLGAESEPLDLGRSARLFSRAQRRTMSRRDGGCLWPGCTAPPGWCEVAHLEAWARGGPTDLANGILLCPFHHRRFDRDGWRLEQDGARRWLVPPAWVDASRRRRAVRSASSRAAA